VTPNPYPKTIIDEASGEEVSNPLHKAWQEGYESGCNDCTEGL
jgi:hypothetical protein